MANLPTLVVNVTTNYDEKLREAVDDACTCGGGGPGDCCPACEVWYTMKREGFEITFSPPVSKTVRKNNGDVICKS